MKGTINLVAEQSMHIADMKPEKNGTLGETLAPLMEGPVPECGDVDGKNEGLWMNIKFWSKGSKKHADPRLLLGVLGCPLAPVAACTDSFPHLSIKDVPIKDSMMLNNVGKHKGLDPLMTASIFVNAHCVGEKRINDEDCFVLKVSADQSTLSDRSDGPAEIIRHVLFGYFSQKTGWLVYLEDSHLTRIQATGSEAVYWETTIESTLKDYKDAEGIMLAHSGHSVVTLFRFGEDASNHTRTRMEETWSIEEVAFNVPGLSPELFIPPAEIVSPKHKEASTRAPLRSGSRNLSLKQV